MRDRLRGDHRRSRAPRGRPSEGDTHGANLDRPDRVLSEEELTYLALDADPDAEVAPDAVPLDELLDSSDGAGGEGLLPTWYMPAPSATAGPLRGWRRRVALFIVVSFVLLAAYGLCATYGVAGLG